MRFFTFFALVCMVEVVVSISNNSLKRPPPLVCDKKEFTIMENSTLTLLCKTTDPVLYCRVDIPGYENAFLLRPEMSFDNVKYKGEGLKKGHCGVEVKNLKSRNSGQLNCSVGFEKYVFESAVKIPLIIAMPPDPPKLEVIPTRLDNLREGDLVIATCTVRNSRPPANLTWYLGSRPIYDKLSKPKISQEKNGLLSITQNLSRRLHFDDHGKDLKCVSGHIAMRPGSITHSMVKLFVNFPPKPKSQEYEKFGFTLGKPGKIVVTFHANPTPDIEWKIDQGILTEGAVDRTGRFEAGILQSKGAGVWDAVLNIHTVGTEEVEKKYTLIAKNELGHESYQVVISTNAEPPADFTAGAIVGIVIGVLLILLLVFILIFARATGRWCFAGGVPKAPGESILPYRWGKRTERNPEKVRSLIYKDFTLVQYADGSKSYVSPEEKCQLLLEGKIRAEKSSASLESKAGRTESPEHESDTDSVSVYETPISGGRISQWKDLEPTFSNSELSPGDNGRINLPPYIVPLETSLTYQVSKKKNSEKKKRRSENGKKEAEQEEPERSQESPLENLSVHITDLPVTFRVREKGEDVVDTKNSFEFKGPKIFWERARKRAREAEDLEVKKTDITDGSNKLSKAFEIPRKSFSMPWSKDKERTGKPKDEENTMERTEKPRASKQFSFRLPGPWTDKKKKLKGKFDDAEDGENLKIEPHQYYDLEKPKAPDEENKRSETPDEEYKRSETPDEEYKRSDTPDEEYERSETPDEEYKRPETLDEEYKRLETPDYEQEGESVASEEDEIPNYKLFADQETPKHKNLWNSEPEAVENKILDLEQPIEIFPEPERPKNKFSFKRPKIFFDYEQQRGTDEADEKNNEKETKRHSFGFKVPRLSEEGTKPKDRKPGNKGRFDSNPLQKMFSGQRFKKHRNEKSEQQNEPPSVKPEILEDFGKFSMYRAAEAPRESYKTEDLRNLLDKTEDDNTPFLKPEQVPEKYDPEKEFDTNASIPQVTGYDEERTHGEVQPDVESVPAGLGSDTESADHGSADKSSMSKLTNEKQPKKFMSGLFGSFRKGKKQDKVADNDSVKNPSTFEINVKEQPEHVHIEGPKTEGIVYAELDMARSPGNIMRRDDEKTEYAEIIHPSSKIARERGLEELRKSRENLAMSRENLSGVDEVYSTTTTPDGKKEAAV